MSRDTHVFSRGGVPFVVAGTWSEDRVRSKSHAEPGALFYQVMRHEVWMAGCRASLSPRAAQVLAIIVLRFPGVATFEQIIDKLWGDDPNGGPDNAARLVREDVFDGRVVALAHGFDLCGLHARGFMATGLRAPATREAALT